MIWLKRYTITIQLQLQRNGRAAKHLTDHGSGETSVKHFRLFFRRQELQNNWKRSSHRQILVDLFQYFLEVSHDL